MFQAGSRPYLPARGKGSGPRVGQMIAHQRQTQTGIDRIELRKRNQIKPSEIPYKSPSGATYDSGDFPAILRQALGLRA